YVAVRTPDRPLNENANAAPAASGKPDQCRLHRRPSPCPLAYIYGYETAAAPFQKGHAQPLIRPLQAAREIARSEERRVGAEGTARGAQRQRQHKQGGARGRNAAHIEEVERR